MQPKNDLPRLVRRSVRSPPSFGHLMPSGMERVPLHSGYLVHARNSPKRPVLMTISEPQRWHFSSVGRSGARSFFSDFTQSQLSLYLVHARYGPKRPVRSSMGEPHFGHFSSLSFSSDS